ncbi:hypothetical protein DID88_002869 [Monilinia fructigena]|uniref:GPI-anchored wall transfer protein n=1 Tax=Monilinia fructigena TaxID=38457 RepID=A0A395INY2_9HELO|nr:hypothetical protein DID88_002869 [Monilinia fructigena]
MSRAAEAAMAASYKSLKEDFVSNLTGGGLGEINIITAVAPVAIILWSTLQTRQSFFTPYTPITFAVDFLLNVGAILLAISLYADMPLILNILLLAPVILLYAIPPQKTIQKATQKKPRINSVKNKTHRAIEPAPEETLPYHLQRGNDGYHLFGYFSCRFQDFSTEICQGGKLGNIVDGSRVGSFVFSGGLVGARPLLKELSSTRTSSKLSIRLYNSLRHALPLIVLGTIRLYSVKGLDYAEHVTEYGVHWNFFFTLAFIPPFVAVFQSAFQLIPSYALLAIILGSLYQVALEYTSLKAFILTAPRTDMLSKNREGIFSFFGYLAIFLAGQATGMFVLPRNSMANGNPVAQRRRLLKTMGVWSGIWITLYMFTTSYKYGLALNVSRRLANLPYFLWVSAFNCSQLTAFCLVETIFSPAAHQSTDAKTEKENYELATSRVLESFNRNGLAIFLAANLLTGLVNLTIPTLFVSNLQAMGILLLYASVLTGFAVGLDVYDISIKM